MQGARDVGNALMIALISIGLMVGALSISLVEFVPESSSATATSEFIPSPAPVTATASPFPTMTPTIGLESPTATITSTFVNTATPPASCPPPFGWTKITIRAGETIQSIAARYRISIEELRRANCLSSDDLLPETVLYVPPAATSTVVVCNQGASGWAKTYTVKAGDTFYAIAANYYTAANLLKSVNCRSSDLIYAGEKLWVPIVATRTPYPTPLPGSTVTPFPTDPLTQTALPFTLTVPPTDTAVPSTATTAPTLTEAPTPTASLTAFPPSSP